MDQVLVELEDKLINLSRFAKIIMWLSVISVINTPLFLIALLLFLIYIFKLSKLKNNQSLSGIYNRLMGNTRKELKSIQSRNEPLEQPVAGLLLAHKSMVTVLIVVGIISAIIIGVILIYALLGYSFT